MPATPTEIAIVMRELGRRRKTMTTAALEQRRAAARKKRPRDHAKKVSSL